MIIYKVYIQLYCEVNANSFRFPFGVDKSIEFG